MLIRYIGMSSQGMKRPRQHRHRAGSTRDGVLCREWLADLHDAGIDFDIAILAESSIDQLKQDERWWIAFGRACGWPLTNMTDGGEGCLNPHPLTRAKLKEHGKAQAAASPGVASERAKRQMSDPRQRELRRALMLRLLTPAEVNRRAELTKQTLAAKRSLGLLPSPRRKPPPRYGPRRPRKSRAKQGAPHGISAEGRIRLSEKARARQADPEVRAAIGARTRAALASPEARAKLAARVAASWTPERREWMSEHARKRQAKVSK